VSGELPSSEGCVAHAWGDTASELQPTPIALMPALSSSYSELANLIFDSDPAEQIWFEQIVAIFLFVDPGLEI